MFSLLKNVSRDNGAFFIFEKPQTLGDLVTCTVIMFVFRQHSTGCVIFAERNIGLLRMIPPPHTHVWLCMIKASGIIEQTQAAEKGPLIFVCLSRTRSLGSAGVNDASVSHPLRHSRNLDQSRNDLKFEPNAGWLSHPRPPALHCTGSTAWVWTQLFL